jgi:ribonuclease PH
MVKQQQILKNPIKESVAAVSVGICNNTALLDLEYKEDSSAQVDANFVLTESGKIVEIQGTAEEAPFSKEEYFSLMELAQKGINELINIQNEAIKNAKI